MDHGYYLKGAERLRDQLMKHKLQAILRQVASETVIPNLDKYNVRSIPETDWDKAAQDFTTSAKNLLEENPESEFVGVVQVILLECLCTNDLKVFYKDYLEKVKKTYSEDKEFPPVVSVLALDSYRQKDTDLVIFLVGVYCARTDEKEYKKENLPVCVLSQLKG